MINHRLTHITAVALAIAAASAPAASAMPQDLRNADNRVPDTQPQVMRGIYEPVAPAERPQDLRSPDTVDYANGRGTYNSPEVVVVDHPAPAAQPTAGGIDWEDAGIGAGGLLAVSLIGFGGALFIVHRRGTRELAS